MFEHCYCSSDYDSEMNNSCDKDENISDAAEFVASVWGRMLNVKSSYLQNCLGLGWFSAWSCPHTPAFTV